MTAPGGPGNAGGMRFGVALPTFASPGEVERRSPAWEEVSWPDMLAFTDEVERLGYDALWVADHLELGRDSAILEGWTVIAALAARTERLRLGVIHLAEAFRNPAFTAKQLATLDVLSGGRVEFFPDPLRDGDEAHAYGFPFEEDRSRRVERTAEELELVAKLWTGEAVDHKGTFHTTRAARCTPVPVQPGGPPIWLGGTIDQPMLELIARHAQVWNSAPVPPEDLAVHLERLRAACHRVGRDPATLRVTLETQLYVYDTPEAGHALLDEVDALGARFPGPHPPVGERRERPVPPAAPNAHLDDFVVGTPDEVVAKLRAYQELGVDELIGWFMDFPRADSMRLFASKVAPHFRENRSRVPQEA